jgi:hypothetical protein
MNEIKIKIRLYYNDNTDTIRLYYNDNTDTIR